MLLLAFVKQDIDPRVFPGLILEVGVYDRMCMINNQEKLYCSQAFLEINLKAYIFFTPSVFEHLIFY